jgi:hypothetical protein
MEEVTLAALRKRQLHYYYIIFILYTYIVIIQIISLFQLIFCLFLYIFSKCIFFLFVRPISRGLLLREKTVSLTFKREYVYIFFFTTFDKIKTSVLGLVGVFRGGSVHHKYIICILFLTLII